MGLYNRLANSRDTAPASWTADHPVEDENGDPVNTDKNIDWFKWRIAIHPFTDMIALIIEDVIIGTISQQKAVIKQLFDMSDTEVDQVIEIWQNFINAGVLGGDADEVKRQKQMNNLIAFQSILRSIERGIPQRFVGDLQTWLYNKLGITTPDDR